MTLCTQTPCLLTVGGRVCTACAQQVHSTNITGRYWDFLLQLAMFLPKQTILHPHNGGQPHVSPEPPSAPNCNLNSTSQHSEKHMHNEHIWSKMYSMTDHWYPVPPLQSPTLARDGLPGGGGGGGDGRQVTVSRGGGGGLQGYSKANCGTLH